MKTEWSVDGFSMLAQLFAPTSKAFPQDPPWVMDTQLAKPLNIEFAAQSKRSATGSNFNCCDTLPR